MKKLKADETTPIPIRLSKAKVQCAKELKIDLPTFLRSALDKEILKRIGTCPLCGKKKCS